MTATTWIARSCKLPAGQPLDGGDSAEVEVPAGPLVHRIARLAQAFRRILRPAAFDLDDAVLDVKPRAIDRIAHRVPACDDVVDRLKDRARQPDRPCAAN